MRKVETMLHTLGVGRQYKGYNLTCQMLRLAMEDPARLCNMKRCLFAPVARLNGCDERTLERNIRTLIQRAWDNNAEAMCRMAGYRLLGRPTVGDFLSFMVDAALEADSLSRDRPGTR